MILFGTYGTVRSTKICPFSGENVNSNLSLDHFLTNWGSNVKRLTSFWPKANKMQTFRQISDIIRIKSNTAAFFLAKDRIFRSILYQTKANRSKTNRATEHLLTFLFRSTWVRCFFVYQCRMLCCGAEPFLDGCGSGSHQTKRHLQCP